MLEVICVVPITWLLLDLYPVIAAHLNVHYMLNYLSSTEEICLGYEMDSRTYCHQTVQTKQLGNTKLINISGCHTSSIWKDELTRIFLEK